MTPMMIGLLALLAGPVPANERPYRPFDAEIARVESGGSWKDGEQWGTYRAVVRRGCSPEHCYDDLFIEWLRREDLQPTVLVTKHFAAFSFDGSFDGSSALVAAVLTIPSTVAAVPIATQLFRNHRRVTACILLLSPSLICAAFLFGLDQEGAVQPAVCRGPGLRLRSEPGC
jgi:hypothetical protein